jgi:formate/nitrite transporter
MFFNLVVSDTTLGFAAQRVMGGLAFSLGLMLVVVAGAELFTGNNLLAMAWADGLVSTRQLLRNWLVACLGNFFGAAALALLVHAAGHLTMQQGAVGDSLLRLVAAKMALTPAELFWRGVLCNVLVCLAVWMTLAGRSVMDKAVVIIFPVTAFVAAGFEHSIANMFFFPLAMLHQSVLPASSAMAGLSWITWQDMLANLLPVIAGNSGGAPDAVIEGETGFVVDGNSTLEISQRIIQLLQDPTLRLRMGARGRSWVEERWRWDQIATRHQLLLAGGSTDA